ncbi:MAG: permease-like cell division protein FtsX [Melioribacter sp.]|nr:permease-like cell division protein FtsX [Melioribacter sp.]
MLIFFLKESIRMLKRSPFASMVIISITTIAIMMTGVSFIILQLSNKFSKKVKSSIEITAFLENYIDSSKIWSIKEEIEKLPSVKSVKYISKEEAVEQFIKDTGEDFRNVLTENPLPPSLIIRFHPEKISYENINSEIRRISNISGITEVIYDNEVIVKILKYLKSGQAIVYMFSVLLVLLSIYLVYTNSRIQIEANKNLYQTMKLVGAKLSTIKIPIILYGLMVGLISGICAVGINYILGIILIGILNNLKLHIVFKDIYSFSILAGVLLGFIGSYLSSKAVSLKINQ